MSSFSSQWGKYHDQYETKEGSVIVTKRFERVIQLINDYRIKSITEIAGNQGMFAQMVLDNSEVQQIICSDYDPNAIDILYKNIKQKNLKISPVLMDVIFPISYPYKQPPEARFKSELIIALAVTHHLVLTQKVPLDEVFRIISNYTKKYIAIEFMPLGLYSKQGKVPIPDWYTFDWFKMTMSTFFKIKQVDQLEDNRILFWGEKVFIN